MFECVRDGSLQIESLSHAGANLGVAAQPAVAELERVLLASTIFTEETVTSAEVDASFNATEEDEA